MEDKNIETKEMEKIVEEKENIGKKEKKKEIKEFIPKDKAIVRGHSLRISQKNSKYICKAIIGRNIDFGIELLEKVILKKRVIEMRGAEIPHRKGKGIMSGRYPVNAAKEILVLLKQLKANAHVGGIENPIVKLAVSNKASEPYKKEGRRGKRTHIYIEAVEKTKLGNKKK
jgi:ribosomal protein L22